MRLGPKEKEILTKLTPGKFTPPSVYTPDCRSCPSLNRTLSRIVHDKKLAIFRYQTLTPEQSLAERGKRAPGREAAEFNGALKPTPRGEDIIRVLRADKTDKLKPKEMCPLCVELYRKTYMRNCPMCCRTLRSGVPRAFHKKPSPGPLEITRRMPLETPEEYCTRYMEHICELRREGFLIIKDRAHRTIKKHIAKLSVGWPHGYNDSPLGRWLKKKQLTFPAGMEFIVCECKTGTVVLRIK